MAATIPTREPSEFTQGETVKFTKSLPDYLPADSWVLSYAFTQDGVQKTVTATDNGDGTHLVTIAATTSATYTIGKYSWQARVTLSGEVYQVGEGTIEVRPDLSSSSYSATGYDDRTHAKQMVDAYRALSLIKSEEDIAAYVKESGLQISKFTHEEIRNELAYWERMYAQELSAERMLLGFGNPNKIRTRRIGRQ